MDRDAAVEAVVPEQAEIPVVVAVHIRPLIYDELIQGCRECLQVTTGEPQICCGQHTFSYDHVFGGGGERPELLFDRCVLPLCNAVFKGYNATVFAYGQTGSGKTYTMGSQFTPGEPPAGVIPQVMDTIFQRISTAEDTDFALRVAFIEIHMEEIHDLLLPPGAPQPSITIREMPSGGMCVAGANEVAIHLEPGPAAARDQMLLILNQGTMARATSMTQMNARSSRSHAIFSITVEQRKRPPQPGAEGEGGQDEGKEDDESDSADLSYLCGKMHLVDLAGSERAKRTKATGARLQEGIHINRGLLALGNVIHALTENGRHVPYRDSKLTRLLQDSLGGNSRTVMLACVSPADINMEESINTLRYANRARDIKNKPVVNRDPSAAQLVLLRQQLAAARGECEVLRAQLAKALRGEPIRAYTLEAPQQVPSAAAADGLLPSTSLASNGAYMRVSEPFPPRAPPPEAAPHALGEPSTPPRVRTAPEFDAPGQTSPWHQPLMTPDSARLSEKRELHHRLSSLQEELRRKEAQMSSLTTSVQADALRRQYETMVGDMAAERSKLQQRQLHLQKQLSEMATSRQSDRQQVEKTYKRKLRDVEDQLAALRRLEGEHARLERLKQKSDEMVAALRGDISRIKLQKVALLKQIADIQHDYEAFKRDHSKQITALKRGSAKAESELQRVTALNEKQRAVLQRKIQEAENAKRRLQEMNRKRLRPAAPRLAPGPSVAASAPTMRGQPAPGTTPFASLDGTLAGGGGGVRPNPAAPELATAKAAMEWVWGELEGSNPVHDLRKVLEGELAQRADLSKRALEHDRSILEIDAMPPELREQYASTRAKLSSAKDSLEVAMEHHHRSICKLQADIDGLAKSQDDDPEVPGTRAAEASPAALRWSSVRSLDDAKLLLQSVFKVACTLKDQVEDQSCELTEMRDTVEYLKLRHDHDVNEIELLQAEATRASVSVSAEGTDAARDDSPLDAGGAVASVSTSVDGGAVRVSRSQTMAPIAEEAAAAPPASSLSPLDSQYQDLMQEIARMSREPLRRGQARLEELALPSTSASAESIAAPPPAEASVSPQLPPRGGASWGQLPPSSGVERAAAERANPLYVAGNGAVHTPRSAGTLAMREQNQSMQLASADLGAAPGVQSPPWNGWALPAPDVSLQDRKAKSGAVADKQPPVAARSNDRPPSSKPRSLNSSQENSQRADARVAVRASPARLLRSPRAAEPKTVGPRLRTSSAPLRPARATAAGDASGSSARRRQAAPPPPPSRAPRGPDRPLQRPATAPVASAPTSPCDPPPPAPQPRLDTADDVDDTADSHAPRPPAPTASSSSAPSSPSDASSTPPDSRPLSPELPPLTAFPASFTAPPPKLLRPAEGPDGRCDWVLTSREASPEATDIPDARGAASTDGEPPTDGQQATPALLDESALSLRRLETPRTPAVAAAGPLWWERPGDGAPGADAHAPAAPMSTRKPDGVRPGEALLAQLQSVSKSTDAGSEERTPLRPLTGAQATAHAAPAKDALSRHALAAMLRYEPVTASTPRARSELGALILMEAAKARERAADLLKKPQAQATLASNALQLS